MAPDDALARVLAAAEEEEATAARWLRWGAATDDLAARDLMARTAARHKWAATVIRRALAEPQTQTEVGVESDDCVG